MSSSARHISPLLSPHDNVNVNYGDNIQRYGEQDSRHDFAKCYQPYTMPYHHLASPPASNYVAQDFGKNFCSKGTLVSTLAECRQAALQVKQSSTLNRGSVHSYYYPRGCFAGTTYRNFGFNTHWRGGASASWSPVCRVKGTCIARSSHAHAEKETAQLASPHLTPAPTTTNKVTTGNCTTNKTKSTTQPFALANED